MGQLLVDTGVVLDDGMDIPLLHLPQLDRLVVGGQQHVSIIDSVTPCNLVDLLIDIEALEVVEFGFMRLELGEESILATLFLYPD